MKNKTNLPINVKNKQIVEEIERVYTLGDSEIICKMILEMIISYSYQKLRKNYLNSLLKGFTKSFTFQLIEEVSDLKINIKPEILENNLIPEVYIDELERPKQDNWASNKMNVIFSLTEPNPIINTEELKLGYINSPNMKLIKGENSKRKNVKESKGSSNKILDKSGKKLFEIIEGLENEDGKFFPDDEKKKKKAFLKNIKKDSVSNTVSNDKVSELSQVELIPLTSECKIHNDIFFSKEEEKAIEIYFREKEAEKVRKKKIEEELLLDEERKKMKFKESNLNTLVYDKEGNLMKINYPDPEKFTHLEGGKYIIRSEAELKKYKEKLKKKQNNKKEKLTLKKKKILSDMDLQESLPKIYISEEKVEEQIPEMNYQPDPIKSISLSNGVKLTSYNMKKTSERFNIVNKMDCHQFYDLVKLYKPGYFIQKTDENINKKEKIGITETNEENVNNLSNRFSNVYMILTTEDETIDNETKLKPNMEKYSSALRRSENLFSERIKKRNLHKIKGGTYDDIVKTNCNFRLDTIEQLDNDEVYQNLHYYVDDKNKLKLKKKVDWISPKTHGDITQELGRMTKYPRERISRNLLISTGKVSLNTVKNKK